MLDYVCHCTEVVRIAWRRIFSSSCHSSNQSSALSSFSIAQTKALAADFAVEKIPRKIIQKRTPPWFQLLLLSTCLNFQGSWRYTMLYHVIQCYTMSYHVLSHRNWNSHLGTSEAKSSAGLLQHCVECTSRNASSTIWSFCFGGIYMYVRYWSINHPICSQQYTWDTYG